MGLFNRKKKNIVATEAIDEESLSVAKLAAKAKDLRLKSRKLSTQLFSGQAKSSSQGHGMSFKEVRQYQAGDDVRFIDWNVSARMHTTYSKVFEEEKELSIFLLIDISASNLFGTVGDSKKNQIASIAALLGFAAAQENNNVGAIFFSDKVEKYIPAKKGNGHVMHICKSLFDLRPTSYNTDVNVALTHLTRVSKYRSIVFVVSDFMSVDFSKSLKTVGYKNELIGIHVYDKFEKSLPNVGYLEVADIETGEEALINTRDKEVRRLYERRFQEQLDATIEAFQKADGTLIQVATDDDSFAILQEFFKRMR